MIYVVDCFLIIYRYSEKGIEKGKCRNANKQKMYKMQKCINAKIQKYKVEIEEEL